MILQRILKEKKDDKRNNRRNFAGDRGFIRNNTIAKGDYISYILYIGRADVIPELKAHFGTSCVIDYQLDRYYDETREAFYLHYLNRNYSKEGFKYDGESGIDDLSIEMMIYCHFHHK